MNALSLYMAGLREWLAALPLLRIARGLAVLAVLLAAGLTGWTLRSWKDAGQIAQLHTRIASSEASAARARADAMARARAADADAIATLTQRLATADATTEDLRHALAEHTTGRVCLSAPARRVLQRAPAFAGLPTTAAEPAATRATAAGDPGDRASTDADLGGWALDAARLYEACRARIDAIRRWDEVSHGR